MPGHKRFCIEISGIVQGVGFRPFVYRLAKKAGLTGFVFNHDRGVTIEAQGAEPQLAQFQDELRRLAPPASRIDSFVVNELRPAEAGGEAGFLIRESGATTADKFVPVSPDLAICDDCRREIHDPANRRYFYPFTNCTNCGPRFSIIKDVPYDRPLTTMAPFNMCPACAHEYENPLDRRFHAQPNACANCGPRLSYSGVASQERDARILIEAAVQDIKNGKILAIKGIGGFHLACDARNEEAVKKLRTRKIREFKPFAVMFPDLQKASEYVHISVTDQTALKSPSAPIVLLRKRDARGSVLPIAESVAPHNRELGVLLPYTPLHELLLKSIGGPLVMTSGNRSDEPICRTDREAFETLKDIADEFLTHDREIHIRCDDSVLRGKTLFRRSRGFAPNAIRTADPFQTDLLAVGAELKNTFCLTRAGRNEALLSHHIGDLENLSTLESFEQGIAHFKKLYGVEPKVIAHDLHPDYLNTKWAVEQEAKGLRRIAVQHHHAHIAACLTENKKSRGPVIGLALDGTGFGMDQSVWGGEVLIADSRDFLRVGHLRNARLPAGAAALRQPWMLALAYLREAFPGDQFLQIQSLPFYQALRPEARGLLLQILDKNIRTYLSSSAGRLFDAVSAICGITTEVNYEGQAAIELERALPINNARDEAGYSFGLGLPEQIGQPGQIDWRPVLCQLVKDLETGLPVEVLSRRFHRGLVRAFVDFTVRVSALYQINTVALSGGCFLNEFLRNEFEREFTMRNMELLVHRELPPGDGGLAVGQALVADQRLKGIDSCVWQYR